MKCIFLLSGDYIDLGKEEVVSLFNINKYELKNRLLIVELENETLLKNLSKRLALTKNIYNFLFECKINDLIDIMKDFDWNSIYEDNFCLRKIYLEGNNGALTKKYINQKTINEKIQYERYINGKNNKKSEAKVANNKQFSEKNLAGYIWRTLNNPKVNLENPKTEIILFFLKGKVYCGLLAKKIDYDFDLRKAHKRPFPHPSSLHPKVARALVNLSEIKEGEILLDPFCGTGGFLIEAGLMNIKSIGYDINKIMIKGCKDNLEYFKIQNFKIFHKNALKIFHRFDCAVTDLPYGLNSNAMTGYEKDWKRFRLNKKIQTKNFVRDLEKFYLKFLKNLRKGLKNGRKAVIVFPSYVNYKRLLKQSKFKIEFELSNYVHRSLTRKIMKIR